MTATLELPRQPSPDSTKRVEVIATVEGAAQADLDSAVAGWMSENGERAFQLVTFERVGPFPAPAESQAQMRQLLMTIEGAEGVTFAWLPE